MTKQELKDYIELYRKTEQQITDLDDKYGIRIWDSAEPNFYNNYNLLLHKLLLQIFGTVKTNLLEDYIFNSIEITEDDLYESLDVS